jgi:hypothetical protein
VVVVVMMMMMTRQQYRVLLLLQQALAVDRSELHYRSALVSPGSVVSPRYHFPLEPLAE